MHLFTPHPGSLARSHPPLRLKDPSSQNQQVPIRSVEDGNSRQVSPLLEPELPAQCQTRAIVREHEREVCREPQRRSMLDGMLHQLRRNAGALNGGIDIDADFGSGGVGRPSVEWLETQPSPNALIATGILENPDRVPREIAIVKPGLARSPATRVQYPPLRAFRELRHCRCRRWRANPTHRHCES